MKHDPPLRDAATPKNTPYDLPAAAAPESPQMTVREAHKASRTKLKPADQIKVWVRAGGVCVMCKTYLLDGPLTGLGVGLGELAHIVGQQQNAASPRGQHPLPRQERDKPENVLLACPRCHAEIDKQLVARVLDVDKLMSMKAAHERRIRHVTTLSEDDRTLVLRVVGTLRGNALEVSNTTVARTVTSAGRFPWFDLDRDRIGVEVDLRSVPGELEADESYYATACKAIDETLIHKLGDAVTDGSVCHVSVFPFARLPVLIYLGARLEDNFTVDVYQRHRATQDWAWDPDAEPNHFAVTSTGTLDDAAEAVLVLNVSGSIDLAQLPPDVADLPRFVLAPDTTPCPDVIRSLPSLESFCKAVRDLNAVLDANKGVRRLHVFGALPPAAAVELGRLHDPHIHPALVIHDRTNDGAYWRALEIS